MICCRLNRSNLSVRAFRLRSRIEDYWDGVSSNELSNKQISNLEDSWLQMRNAILDTERRYHIEITESEVKILGVDEASVYEAIGAVVVSRYREKKGMHSSLS